MGRTFPSHSLCLLAKAGESLLQIMVFTRVARFRFLFTYVLMFTNFAWLYSLYVQTVYIQTAVMFLSWPRPCRILHHPENVVPACPSHLFKGNSRDGHILQCCNQTTGPLKNGKQIMDVNFWWNVATWLVHWIAEVFHPAFHGSDNRTSNQQFLICSGLSCSYCWGQLEDIWLSEKWGIPLNVMVHRHFPRDNCWIGS